jgi:hypothetical protein
MRLRAACAASVVALVGALASRGPARGDERVIEYAKDALTVRLTKVPVAEVLDELSRQSGAEIRGQVRGGAEATAQFDAVPLPEALHRLLGDQNFALVYGDGGRLKSVRLLGGTPGEPGAAAVAAAPANVPPPVQVPVEPRTLGLAALVARHAPVPVSGRLATLVGAPNASLQQLLDIGMRNEDATLRAEAVRSVVATLEGDPNLRAAAISEIGSLDDGSLSAILRSAAGEHAEEVAMQILTQARASEIRVKASSVLQKLRAGS